MKKAELVRRELQKLPRVEFTPEEAVILCCFHEDRNPSLRVSLVSKTRRDKKIGPGAFHCFSCGAGGSWNTLAKKLGLELWDEAREEEYANSSGNDFLEFSRDLEGLSTSTQEYVKPVTDGPWEGAWRGLPGSFLRSQGAESFWDKEAGEYRVYLPVRDSLGRLVGHVLARGENSQIPDKKKYLNSKGFNGRSYWYGADYLNGSSVAVIVEGPFDRLRFQYNGIPTVANLGVQLRKDDESSVSDEKITQLLAVGVSKVILAFDADRAGQEAVPGVTKAFRNWGFEVYDLNMSRYLSSPNEKMDPGNCPESVIEDLKNFIETLK